MTVLLPPWILGAILCAMATSRGPLGEAHLFMFWLLVSLLLDAAIGTTSRVEVFDHLRHLVSEGKPPPVAPALLQLESDTLAPVRS